MAVREDIKSKVARGKSVTEGGTRQEGTDIMLSHDWELALMGFELDLQTKGRAPATVDYDA